MHDSVDRDKAGLHDCVTVHVVGAAVHSKKSCLSGSVISQIICLIVKDKPAGLNLSVVTRVVSEITVFDPSALEFSVFSEMVSLAVLLNPAGLHGAEIVEVVAAAVLIGVPAGHRRSLPTQAVGDIIVVRRPHISLLLTCDVKIIELFVHGDPSGRHVAVVVEIVVVSVDRVPA